jgi:hypothetical protein
MEAAVFDDVVIEVLAHKEAGEPFGIDTFLCFIPISRGHQAIAEYHQMAANELICRARQATRAPWKALQAQPGLQMPE